MARGGHERSLQTHSAEDSPGGFCRTFSFFCGKGDTKIIGLLGLSRPLTNRYVDGGTDFVTLVPTSAGAWGHEGSLRAHSVAESSGGFCCTFGCGGRGAKT